MMEYSKELKSDLMLNEFEGVWFDEKNSQGTLKYESGSKYVGSIKLYKRHGRGIYTYPNLEE
jgi:hypothetical protein